MGTPDGRRSLTVSEQGNQTNNPNLLEHLRAVEEDFVCALLADWRRRAGPAPDPRRAPPTCVLSLAADSGARHPSALRPPPPGGAAAGTTGPACGPGGSLDGGAPAGGGGPGGGG